MRYSELTRRLRRLGFVLLDQGKRHEMWGRPSGTPVTPIPRHPSEEIPSGTLSRILKDLGVRRDEL